MPKKHDSRWDFEKMLCFCHGLGHFSCGKIVGACQKTINIFTRKMCLIYEIGHSLDNRQQLDKTVVPVTWGLFQSSFYLFP